MKDNLEIKDQNSIDSEVTDFEFEYEADDIEFSNEDDVEFLNEDDTEFLNEDEIEFSDDENSIKEQSEIFKKLREERKRNNNSKLHN